MGSERIAIAPEVTFGVNPGSGFVYYPFTGDSLALTLRSVQSGEVNPNRNPRGSVRVGAEQGGGFNIEMKLEVFNPLLSGLFLASFGTATNLTARSINISAVTGSPNHTATFTDAGVANAFVNVVVGQVVQFKGFDVNGTLYVYVASRSDSVITGTVVRADGTTAVTNEAGQTDIAIKANMLRIGDVEKSFSIEKQFPTGTAMYQLALAAMVQTLNFGIEPGQLITGAITFLGRAQATSGTSQAGSPANAASREILNAIDHIKGVKEGAFTSDAALRVSRVGVDWSNNLTGEEEVGKFGLQGIERNIPAINGNLRFYRNSTGIIALQQKYEAGTVSKFSCRFQDLAGNAAVLTFPQIRYTAMPTLIPGNTGSRYADGQFSVEEDVNLVAAQYDFFSVA